MSSSPILGGGFLWVMADEGLMRHDTGLIDVDNNRAPDGIVGPYHEKEGSYYTIRELWSPISLVERRLPANFDDTLSLENHYSFINSSSCQFTRELRRFSDPGEKEARTKILMTGLATAPDIAPGAQGKLSLELPAIWREADQTAVSWE